MINGTPDVPFYRDESRTTHAMTSVNNEMFSIYRWTTLNSFTEDFCLRNIARASNAQGHKGECKNGMHSILRSLRTEEGDGKKKREERAKDSTSGERDSREIDAPQSSLFSRAGSTKRITSNPAPPSLPAARRLTSLGEQGSSWKNSFHRTQSSRP